jgi:hypothetical protein
MTKVLSETDSERLGLAFYRAIGAVIDANPDVDPWDLSGALGKAVHVLDTKKDPPSLPARCGAGGDV